MKMNYPAIMGILNVTPDSFSDGGRYNSVDAALRHSEELLEQGADIVSDVAISGIAPGQFGVLYHETEPYVVGSGVIVEKSEE